MVIMVRKNNIETKKFIDIFNNLKIIIIDMSMPMHEF
jgi:hypothetical protein